MPFVQAAIAPGSRVPTDGWLGYEPLRRHGYRHRITFLEGQSRSPSQLLPHVHQVVSLLKRWLLGTQHGAVTHEHLEYYLDEFTFRFNRRRARQPRQAVSSPRRAGGRCRAGAVRIAREIRPFSVWLTVAFL